MATPRRTRKTAAILENILEDIVTKTPEKGQTIVKINETEILQENVKTPRRSARKSVKPNLDYNDIIVRSTGRKRKIEGEESKSHWSCAEVGKYSGKRGKKSRRNLAINKEEKLTQFVEKVEEENKIEDISMSIFSPNKVEKRASGVNEDTEKVVQNTMDVNDIEQEEITLTERKESKNSPERESSNKNLKQQFIAVTLLDMGLQPLEDEEDDEKENENNENKEDIKMESLIVYDDDEISEKKSNSSNILNETFDASDCILISPNVQECLVEEHPTPQISEATPITKKSMTKKLPRQSTPYRVRGYRVSRSDVISSPTKGILMPLANLEIEKNTLPRIRKRSASMTEGNKQNHLAEKKSKNRVTFYSPANQTLIIENSENVEKKDGFVDKSCKLNKLYIF